MKKRILIFNSAPVYPINGMNSVRVINQIKGLSKNHLVDFLFLHKNADTTKLTKTNLSAYCNQVIPFKTISQSFFFRVLRKIFLRRLLSLINYPDDYFSNSNRLSAYKIAKFVNHRDYDIVISHYWQSSGFLRYLNKNIVKCIDTHYAVEENIELFNAGQYAHLKKRNLGKILNKELRFQNQLFSVADMLIVNSNRQEELIRRTFHDVNIQTIPNGQDIKKFLDYKLDGDEGSEKNIVFYGALSNQFNDKALRRLVNRIFPELKKLFPKLKLIALGANPPQWLNDVSENENILITGFVDDIRPVLSKCQVALLPLESAAGFRGRTIELMAMGVPVVGTHNALESLQLENEVHAYVVDSDEEIVSVTLELLNSLSRRKEMADRARDFVCEKYSLDATFGKLSNYFDKS